MAEKKKLTTAEILAAARKADAKGSQEPEAAPPDSQSQTPPAEAAASPPASEPPPPAAEPPKPAAKPSGSGGKPSVADILAMARAEKQGGAKPEESAEAPAKPAAEKPAAPAKPASSAGGRPSVADILAMARQGKGGAAQSADEPAAEQPSPKPAAKSAPAKPSPAKAAASEPSSTAAGEPAGPPKTASILAAARAEKKRGPQSKAEAGLLVGRDERRVEEAIPRAGKPVVPPMPPKPAYAQKKPETAKPKVDEGRRGVLAMLSAMVGTSVGIGFGALAGTAGLWSLSLARFMFPNILTEPPSQFRVGQPSDFPPGMVDERFKAAFGVWIVNAEYNGQQLIYALKTVCTHLGCTPNWLESEQKFKCPCHGSGFYIDGINFEGPAPRPLERYAIRVADDGQLEIDKSRVFQEEKGEWANPDSYVVV